MAKVEIDEGSGFCFGVVTAINKAEEELSKSGTLYCLGDIVHNSREVERLKAMGLYVAGGTGTLTPYTGVFFFAVGILASTPIFNTFAMKHPVEGKAVTMKDYFAGDAKTHLTGMLGGFIWMGGMVISFMGAGAANPAISYALSNAAPVVAMIWGVFVWKEFKEAPKGTNKLIAAMFSLFIIGLISITLSN